MSAVLVFAEKHCPRCRRMREVAEFATKTGWCRECRAKYSAARAAAIKGGTWAPAPRENRPPQRPHHRVGEKPPERRYGPVILPIPEGAAAGLRAFMLGFLNAYGFSALRHTLDRLEGELAREHREQLARQGWIA